MRPALLGPFIIEPFSESLLLTASLGFMRRRRRKNELIKFSIGRNNAPRFGGFFSAMQRNLFATFTDAMEISFSCDKVLRKG